MVHGNRGLYFGLKTIFIPPPFWKWYFFPSRDMSFFDFHRGFFALILPFLPFSFPFLPFSFPFLPFSFPFLPFLSPFFLFRLHFLTFSHGLFIFFPPNDIGWYYPPLGGGIFQYIDPCMEIHQTIHSNCLQTVRGDPLRKNWRTMCSQPCQKSPKIECTFVAASSSLFSTCRGKNIQHHIQGTIV